MADVEGPSGSGCGCGDGSGGGCGCGGGGAGGRGWIVGALVLVVALAVVSVFRNGGEPVPGGKEPGVSPTAGGPAIGAGAEVALPRLLDLGAHACIPCKMMAPILEDLRTNHAGRMAVDFIDVWKDPGAGKQYGIQSIPTQIFFDANGKELFRHEGFMSKGDILGKWKELGIDVTGRAGEDVVERPPVAPAVQTTGDEP